MDALPFNLPLEICEIIFSHLNTRELINVALVSKSWSRFINLAVMKNISLRIDDKISLEDILKVKRNYMKVKLVRLKGEKLIKVLDFFSKTVVELDLKECEGLDNAFIALDNLSELALSHCETTNVFKLFIPKIKNLKVLHLYYLRGAPCDDLKRFLEVNSASLEEINFYLDESSQLFEDATLSSQLNLRLKSTFISNKSNIELPSSALLNIEKFLSTQGEHLQIISLVNSANLVLLLRIWNNLTALKRLYFFATDPFFDYSIENISLQLQKNPNLIELELHSLTPFPFRLDDIRPFIEAAPNLERISFWHLSKRVFDFITRENFLIKLKIISCITLDDECRVHLKSKNGINGQQIRLYLL